jgi:serine/threonine protein kinase
VKPERWSRLKELFDQALNLGANERDQFVSAVGADDPGLERSLAALLAHHHASDLDLAVETWTAEHIASVVLAEFRGFEPGEVVANRFRVEQFLAEGGMGAVYSAEDLELNERVALKTIRPDLARNEEVLARFKREIQLARKVTHRNVSRVFDLFRHNSQTGEQRSVVFLSMELLQGETLWERIRRTGPLGVAEAHQIAAQLVAGLDAAHRAGIIHRDFKSGNVVLVPEPGDGNTTVERAVIMDFGLASSLRSDAGRESDQLTGTPSYMAPEQVEGGPITTATDIYALGIVLFETISGRVPFKGGSPLETARLRLSHPAPSVRSIVPSVSSVWDATVSRCLERDPAKRPASAREVEERLTGRFERQKRLRIAAVLLLLATLGGAAWYWSQLPYVPSAAAQSAADSARVKLQNNTQSGFIDAVEDYRRAIQLDGRWALPRAELAHAYATAANAQHVPGAVALKEARSAAVQAIELDTRSAKAYGALGWVQSLDFDEWPQAEAALTRAIELDPSDAQAHFWLGVHLRKKGRFQDAEREDQLALNLSRQTVPQYWCELAFLYWTFDRLDLMDALMKELLVAHPNFGFSRYLHARLLKEQGRFDEALAELAFSEQLQYASVTVMAERASIEAYRGNTKAAFDILAALTEKSATQSVDTLLIAGVYAKLGDADTALTWLERGYARRDNTLLSLATSPLLKPLRSHPRFIDLRRRLGFDR